MNKKNIFPETKNMKQAFSILICFLVLILIGCSKNEQASASSLDAQVASEIEQIENIETLDDETIKALSVLIRTKIKNNDIKNNMEYTPKKEHIYNIVKSTENELLKETSLNKLNYTSQEDWSIKIKKSEILKFLASKNISLSNISDITPFYTKDGLFDYLLIGGKKITYQELAENFNLNSNNIKDIKNNTTSIEIIGTGYPEKTFNIEKANEQAKKGKTYKEILREYYIF